MSKFNWLTALLVALVSIHATADPAPTSSSAASLPWRLTIETPAYLREALPQHADPRDAGELSSPDKEMPHSQFFSEDGQFRRHSTGSGSGQAFVQNYLDHQATVCELNNILEIAKQLKVDANHSLAGLLSIANKFNDPIGIEVVMQRYNSPEGTIHEMYRLKLKSFSVTFSSRPVFADGDGCGIRQGLSSIASLSEVQFLVLLERISRPAARAPEAGADKMRSANELEVLRRAVSEELEHAGRVSSPSSDSQP